MDSKQNVLSRGLSQESEMAIYRQMLELNKEIAFEWDLKADRITCSPKWEERFGYPFGKGGVGKFATATVYIHPDDVELLKEAADRIRAGERATALWCACWTAADATCGTASARPFTAMKTAFR